MSRSMSSPRHCRIIKAPGWKDLQDNIREQWGNTYLNRRRFPKQLYGADVTDSSGLELRPSTSDPITSPPDVQVSFPTALDSSPFSGHLLPAEPVRIHERPGSTLLAVHADGSLRSCYGIPPPSGHHLATSYPRRTTSEAVPGLAFQPVAPLHSIPSVPFAQAEGTQMTSELPTKEVRPFRAGQAETGCTVWYWTSAPYMLQQPPPFSALLSAGDLFIHTDMRNGSVQTWLRQANMWTPAHAGANHPAVKDRYLWPRSNGEPSWITGQTMKGYRSKLRREEFESLRLTG
ncbi:hypothetical protein PHLCEN_2v11852 [Hermanssonia centrifuga]|uniref:Uncharacterized protein n=1 Tax=Hermanssonia centrifuga TaxID=98765 RepID=A0A2R6NIR2_9APHY|nr:hypothetical protein PHLCEN_2v11852 [Hermanssonia centrifuga]